MIISIASGKGGTGKTTIAVNLAAVLGPRAQILDCDVEQPNAHLFLQPNFYRSEPVYTPVPDVNRDRCTLCGECESLCRFKAIVVVGDQVMTFPELCHSCGGCFAVCPEDAITETGRELGTIEAGLCDGLLFIHGRSRVGEAMSPPLIRRVRAEGEPDRITIIDAPPGTSCPVIAAMKGADFVLLVTEPTPFGLNDLELAAGAVDVLGIPAGLVINRADIGDDRVKEYAASVGLPILLELPFDRRVAEVYSRGELLVTAIDGMKSRFEGLYADIEAIVARRRAS